MDCFCHHSFAAGWSGAFEQNGLHLCGSPAQGFITCSACTGQMHLLRTWSVLGLQRTKLLRGQRHLSSSGSMLGTCSNALLFFANTWRGMILGPRSDQ